MMNAAAAMAAVGCLVAAGQALADQGHIQFYSGSTGETFNFDTSAGVVVGDYLVFQTTGDTLGQSAVFFGDGAVSGEFGTGTFEAQTNGVDPTFQIDYFDGASISNGPYGGACCASAPLFDGVHAILRAERDTSYIGGDSSEFSFSGAPEPAAWALLLLGFGGVGGALRGRARGLRAA